MILRDSLRTRLQQVLDEYSAFLEAKQLVAKPDRAQVIKYVHDFLVYARGKRDLDFSQALQAFLQTTEGGEGAKKQAEDAVNIYYYYRLV